MPFLHLFFFRVGLLDFFMSLSLSFVFQDLRSKLFCDFENVEALAQPVSGCWRS